MAEHQVGCDEGPVEELKSFLDGCDSWLDANYEGNRDYQYLFRLLKKHHHLAMQEFVGYFAISTFPLSYLLAAKAPLEMIQEVHEMNPDAIKTRNSESSLPLHDAINYECGHEVVAFLLGKYPRAAQDHASCGLPIRCLLDHLKKEDKFNGREFCKIFQMLYDACPRHSLLIQFSSGELMSQLMASYNTPPELLVWMAKKQNTTCIVKLQQNVGDPALGAMIQNLKHLVPVLECDKLQLCGITHRFTRLNMNTTFLEHLFAQINAPPALKIEIISFDIPILDNLPLDIVSSQICNLSIVKCSMKTESLHQLLKICQTLPVLKLLKLEPCARMEDKLSCTTQVIELLDSAPTLDKLSLVGPKFNLNVDQLCQAIQQSQSTAFVDYRPGRYSPPCIKTAYHSAMNQHGRYKISSSDATQELLVECLCSIHNHVVDGCFTTWNLEESLWYGLLRQAPGLWATDVRANIKKRPACEQLQPKKVCKME